MKKIKDKDKPGISTGTTKIEGFHGDKMTEHTSTSKSQKPKSGGTESVSRGQRIKC